MIDAKSSKIIFHSVNKEDGMLIQVSRKVIEDLLECIDDRLEKIVIHNNENEAQYPRLISYRDQFMSQITKLA